MVQILASPWLSSETHLQRDVSPVDPVVCDVEVQRRGLLDSSQRDGHIVVVGLQGNAANVRVARKEQEGLRDDAGPHVSDQFQTDGAVALHAVRREEAQVAAAAVGVRTWVCT